MFGWAAARWGSDLGRLNRTVAFVLNAGKLLVAGWAEEVTAQSTRGLRKTYLGRRILTSSLAGVLNVSVRLLSCPTREPER